MIILLNNDVAKIMYVHNLCKIHLVTRRITAFVCVNFPRLEK
jgi:hypothetical protein